MNEVNELLNSYKEGDSDNEGYHDVAGSVELIKLLTKNDNPKTA